LTKSTNTNAIVGIMSGTSLDGLDIAVCEFKKSKKGYKYKITGAQTIEYTDKLKRQLKTIYNGTAHDYFKLNHQFGTFIGLQVKNFLKKNKLKAQAIASHGHTIFHEPKLGFSTQIGCGASIAASSGLKTVCDFRSLDVAFHGQGAPLVPIGDSLLFNEFEACLNLGGIANISFSNSSKKRIAFDICICNIALNYLAEKKGKPFDKDGKMAKKGTVNQALLKKLNAFDFYSKKGSKSLGFEWFELHVLPLLSSLKNNVIEDTMATFAEHIAIQISTILNKNKIKNVFVTGGGAFNTHLIQLIKQKTKCKISIPNSEIINFKEALIFAFLGYLRINEEVNTLKTVTGAKQNSIGGAIYLAKSK